MNHRQTEVSSSFLAIVCAVGLIFLFLFGAARCSNSRSHRSSYTTDRFQTTYKYVPTTTTTTTTRRTTYSARPYTYHKTTKATRDDDPLNAKDYVDADDFYYDHYDDFFDYEDAEDYWRENS